MWSPSRSDITEKIALGRSAIAALQQNLLQPDRTGTGSETIPTFSTTFSRQVIIRKRLVTADAMRERCITREKSVRGDDDGGGDEPQEATCTSE